MVATQMTAGAKSKICFRRKFNIPELRMLSVNSKASVRATASRRIETKSCHIDLVS